MTKKIKLSTFAILVAFIAIIAVSCSERATEPETSLSASATVQPDDTVQPGGNGNTEQPGDTVQPNPSVVYNSIADLYGKTLRTENAVTADGLWYVWVKVASGDIQYAQDTSPTHADKYQPTTSSADGSFVNGSVKGKLEVKNGSATITFTEGVELYSKEDPGLNKPYKLIEK